MADQLSMPVGARDHVRGADGAPVTLVEYGDFECPHCRAAYPVLKELEARFGNRLRFVYRHFPLTNVHPHAQAAAEAAEWAAGHGRFWELHDAIYEHPQDLSAPALSKLAAGLGLDVASLPAKLHDHAFFARVKEDFLAGIKSGVKGTPAFFVDGVRHEGSVGTLGDAIAAALAR
jgi:protein-disulfide isomerase